MNRRETKLWRHILRYWPEAMRYEGDPVFSEPVKRKRR